MLDNINLADHFSIKQITQLEMIASMNKEVNLTFFQFDLSIAHFVTRCLPSDKIRLTHMRK